MQKFTKVIMCVNPSINDVRKPFMVMKCELSTLSQQYE